MDRANELVYVKVGNETYGPLMRANADSLTVQLALKGIHNVTTVENKHA